MNEKMQFKFYLVLFTILSIIRAETIEEAMMIENNSQYGNAASVFTTSGEIAKIVSDEELT